MFRTADLHFEAPYRALGITDLPRLFYSLVRGPVIYLDAVMSLYRQGIPNSYSYQNNYQPQRTLTHLQRLVTFFTWYQTQVPHQRPLLEHRIQRLQLQICAKTHDRTRRKQLSALITSLSVHDRFIFELAYWTPSLYYRLSAYRLNTHLKEQS
jgi:hypothetical protein